ncbi:MAG: SWIM zinc finger family protein [Solirubrobacteraceae bacterium]
MPRLTVVPIRLSAAWCTCDRSARRAAFCRHACARRL